METKGTVIGLGTEKPGSKLEELKKEISKKDGEIKKLSEENTSLKKKINELEKGGSTDGTNEKDTEGSSGASKGKKS
nr:MAG TPA: G protein pathway suppressor 2, SMRT, TBL1, co-repressor, TRANSCRIPTION [Caudoviricetes sp.]